MDPAVETAKTNANWVYGKQGVDPQQVDELIKTAVKTCVGDQDALDVVVKTIGNIIMRGDDTLRSPEDLRKKVDAILANVVELRDAAKGDPSIMKHGKTFLMTLDGKSLKPDVMTQLVQKAKTMKVDKIKSLSASSNATAIHKAIRQFTDNLNSVLNDSGASKILEGGDERDAGRDFLIGLMSDKCGKSAARNIQAALNSPKAALLYRIYDDIETKKIILGDFSEALGEYVAQQGDVCSNMMNQLKYMVDSECGIPLNRFKEVERFDGDMNYAELNIGVITTDIEKAARTRMERERKEYLDSKVVGEGPAADAFKDMIEKRLGPEAFHPNQIIRDNSGQNLKIMLNWALMSDCKKFATGQGGNTVFAKDIKRNLHVTLPGGEKLSNDFTTARDQIASFITKGAKADYASLNAEEKSKTHVVMSLLSQEMEKSALGAIEFTLQPEGKDPAFSLTGDESKNKREFELQLNDNGDVDIDYYGTQDMEFLHIDQEKGVKSLKVGPGSTINLYANIHLSAKEMDRLAKLDYSKFDDLEAQHFINELTCEDKLTKINDSFTKDFQLAPNISCQSNFTVTIK